MVRKVFIAGALALVLFFIYSDVSAQGLEPADNGIPEGAEFVPGELLVRFRPGVGNLRAQQVLAERGAAQIRAVQALNVQVLRLPPGLSVEQAVETFNKIPEVEFAESNYIFRIAEISDPGLGNQWAPQKIDALQAWLTTEGDALTAIAIVDTGVDYRHSELNPNMWTHGEIPGNGLDDDGNGYIDDVHGWDYVNNDGDPLDDHFHGTHVAGIAAAVPNSNPDGLVGVCPRCSIMAVKVLNSAGSGTLDGVANGITYAADNGAKVISMSLGAGAGSVTLESAVNYAWNKGTVLVAAAGNDGADSRLYPANYANVMAIASTNDGDYRSCFSSFGKGYISVAAPGEAIYSTTLVDALGNDTYGTFSGTSMATPHAAGLAGLLFSLGPTTNTEVRNLVEASTNDLGTVGADAYFGTGRINANRAVTDDTIPTAPPAGLFSDDLTASGYAHARKLVRDGAGKLHLVWHGRDGGQYRVLYSTSSDDGATWSPPQVVFSSDAETFHPALATDASSLFLAFPSKAGSGRYRVLFTSMPLSGGGWTTPVALTAASYSAVRPDLYYDLSSGLHMAASSFDDAKYVYYTHSIDGGSSWSSVKKVNVDSTGGQRTRYADVHADGSNIYIAGRTVEFTFFGLIPRYRVFTIRSSDNGGSWSNLTELAVHDGWLSGEYGASLAGDGGKLYLAYEHAGTVYFRESADGASWSAATGLGGGAWPSIARASDGQAWTTWESGGNLTLRHYDGSGWDPAESIGSGNYPNLKLGTSGNTIDWVASHCSGAPYRVTYDSRALVANSTPVAVAGGPYSGTEDAAITFNGSGSSDPDGDTLSYTWDFGDATTGSGVSPTHAYAYGGTFTVTLTVNDGKGGTDADSTTATVAGVNDPPVADPNGPYSGTVGAPIAFDGSGSFDPDNQDGTPANDQTLTYTWDFGDGSTGTGISPSHTYSAADDYIVGLVVNDGVVDSAPATTTVSVTAPNSSPVANDVTATGDEDTLIAWTPSVSDPDEDPLTCSIVSQPIEGSASVQSDCTSGSYTPNPNFNGADLFTYKVNDGTDDSDPATVSVTVNPVNDPPVAGGDTASTTKNTSVTINVLANDSDVDGDVLSVSAAGDPPKGSATVNADDTITYTPDTGFTGTDSFTYDISDGKGGTDTATVTVTVAGPTAETLTITKANYNSRKVELKVEATSSLGGDTELVATFFVGGVESAPKPLTYNSKKDKWSVTFTLGDGLSDTKPEKVKVSSLNTSIETTNIGGK